jgi:hypothetical protein
MILDFITNLFISQEATEETLIPTDLPALEIEQPYHVCIHDQIQKNTVVTVVSLDYE